MFRNSKGTRLVPDPKRRGRLKGVLATGTPAGVALAGDSPGRTHSAPDASPPAPPPPSGATSAPFLSGDGLGSGPAAAVTPPPVGGVSPAPVAGPPLT